MNMSERSDLGNGRILLREMVMTSFALRLLGWTAVEAERERKSGRMTARQIVVRPMPGSTVDHMPRGTVATRG